MSIEIIFATVELLLQLQGSVSTKAVILPQPLQPLLMVKEGCPADQGLWKRKGFDEGDVREG